MKSKVPVNQNAYDQILDSIFHALMHFSEADESKVHRNHHVKWIVLSTHHAVESYLKLVLEEVDPTNKALPAPGSAEHYPSFRQTKVALQKISEKLSVPDKELLDQVRSLEDVRDEILHRHSPIAVDLKLATLPLLLLTRAFRTKFRLSPDDLGSDSSLEESLFMALTVDQMNAYVKFMETFLRKEFPTHDIQYCDACGGQTVLFNDCEACFAKTEA